MAEHPQESQRGTQPADLDPKWPVDDPKARDRLTAIILESAQDFISIIDAHSFQILAASKSILTLLGQPEEAVLGQPCHKLFFGLDEPCTGSYSPCPLLLAKESGSPATVEKTYDAHDGRQMCLEVTASPVSGPDGSIQQAVYVVRDITGRKRLEERLQLVTDNVPNLIWHVDTEGRYVFVNGLWLEWFGLSEGEVVGHHVREVLGDELFHNIRPHMEAAFAGGEGAFEAEFANAAEGGILRPVLVRYKPRRDQQGNVTGVFATATDVTERKLAEEALEEERRRLQALVDTSPVGIFFANAAGEVVLVNREGQRILGFAQDPEGRLEWYEQNVVYLRPNGTAYKPAELPLQRSLATGETVLAEEIRFQFPDGHSLLTLVSTNALRAPDGDVTGAVAVIEDLTPIEESERLRNEFLGLVSHELKTPLAAIKGTAAMVLGSQRYSDSPETRELFEIVDEQTDRLTDLVNNLLDMTRIEAGALHVNPEPTDLRQLLLETVATFRRSYPRELHLDVPEDLPAARADRQRIAQVGTNLLTNAAKFSPDESPVSLEAEHNDSHVTVRVRDHGRGIPAEKAGQLFKKFAQVHEDSGGTLGGSGLGLAIARGIVEAHGGRIWAESEGEDRGSTFAFTVPVSADAPPTPTIPAPAERAEQQGRVARPGGRSRILAIDDDPNVLRLLRRALHEAGYEPIVSTNPAETIGLVESRKPDLVLLDLMLPGPSGFDLLQRVRESSGVPVIFLTASDAEEHTVRTLKMGADDYITKPFSPSELLARIETVLRRRIALDVLETRPPFLLGDLAINFAERRVTVASKPVRLSPKEYKILHELAVNAGRVLTHDQILQKVWGLEYSGETELVRSMVRNLRRKLGDDGRHPHYIHTEPEVGYRVPRA